MFDTGSCRSLVSVRCLCSQVLRVNLCLLGIEDSVWSVVRVGDYVRMEHFTPLIISFRSYFE